MRSASPAAIAARNAVRFAIISSTNGTTTSLLSTRMSRHIAGLEAAMRVVSRKLVVGRRRRPCTSSASRPASTLASA